MPNEHDQQRLIEAFAGHGVDYMLIGAGAAILQGHWGTTQDIDVYPRKSPDNCQRLVAALRDLGFDLDAGQEAEIMRGKDFIQLLEPFDLDIVFAPDGFNSYEEALRHRTTANGAPVMNVDGIIKSKESANRPKDRTTLPDLYEFREYLRRRARGENDIPPGPPDERPKDRQARIDNLNRFVAAQSRPADAQMRRMFNAGKRFAMIRNLMPAYLAFDTMDDYRRFCCGLPRFYGMSLDTPPDRFDVESDEVAFGD